MIVRANSLPRVLLDGVFFAVAMGIASAAFTAFAQESTPRTERVNDVLTDRRLTDDHVDSQLNTDDNLPSGNPVESPEAKREAMMLGMKLYEVRTGNIRVDDVAATSPAWDAGIRKGDRLVSIDTLKPQSLSPWVQDVGKILKGTPDGNSIAAAVERNGETLALRIRVPVSTAAEVRDARQEERAIANMAAGNPQQMQQLGQQGVAPVSSGDAGAAAPYGGHGGYGGWGLGGFFDDGNPAATNGDRIATNAVAHLMAVTPFGPGMNEATLTEQTREQANQRGQTGQGAQAGSGQVGIAGFQNNGQGVRAAVVVRGLPPGMYQVGIGHGDMAGGMGGGGFGTGVGTGNGINNDGTGNLNGLNRQRSDGANGFAPGDGANPSQQRPQGAQPIDRPGVQQPINNQPQPTPFTPQRPNSGGTTPPAGGGAAGAGGASLADPKGLPVLAQQLSAQQLDALNDPQLAPQTGQGTTQPAQPGNPPNAGNANQPFDGSAQNRGTPNGNNFPAGMNPGGMGSPQFVAEIGVLQVAQDGSGRVENQIEGLQVENLAGMSVMVVSSQAAVMGTNVPVGGQNQGTAPNSQQAAGGRTIDNPNLPAAGSGGMGGSGVVATGVIQIAERGGGGAAFNDPGTQTGNQPQDTSGSEDLRDRNRIDQSSDFNPRSPQQ